jgi:two-component system, NtrC family, response regulator HydG
MWDRMAEAVERAARAQLLGTILLVDDEPLFLRALERILHGDRHALVCAASAAEAERALADGEIDLVLADLRLGAASGVDLLEHVKRARPDVEVVMMTGHGTVESAVDCMRRGAFDYLEKPFGDPHRVRAVIARAIERRRLVARNRDLERELAQRGHSALIGSSPKMRAVLRTIESLRHNESSVLIQGESGTGKELVAAAVHAASPRRGKPFVPVDCGALPESIIESELFGNQRGAFTGATGAIGLFRVADGGTLFLDEIGEIAPSIQAKLLRALQQREVRPVGSAVAVPVDLRIVAATNRDLAQRAEAGEFRLDLFYRLNVVRIELPALRERSDDIPLLAQHFLAKHRRSASPVTGFEPEALHALTRHSWPGNVRELENAVESAVALATAPLLRARDFALGRERIAPASAASAGGNAALPLSFDAYERDLIERALAASEGDAVAAARKLGVGRSTLYRKLAKHQLAARRPRAAATTPSATPLR